MANGFSNLGVEPHVFMNSVRAALPENYKHQLPVSIAGQKDYSGTGKVLSKDNHFASLWHQTAINLVGKILFRDNIIVNPLAEFEGDLMTNGDKVEEMILDAAETFMFNPTRAEKKLFSRRVPELKAVIHTRKRDVSNLRTLQDTVYTDIFHNVAELDHYVVAVTQSMLSGNEFEKYYFTKETVSEAIYEGQVRKIDLGSGATAKQLQKVILKMTKLMSHPSRYFNMGNVGQPGNKGETGINIQADFSQLRMLLPVTTSVDLNVDFFASAFHLDAVKSGLAIKEVDYFPSLYKYTADHTVTGNDLAQGYLSDEEFDEGSIVQKGAYASQAAYEASKAAGGLNDIEMVFDGSRVQAVILDRRALVIHPMIPVTLSSEANPLGRYTNVVLNDKGLYSWSPFMPACVIMSDDPVETFNLTDLRIDGESIVGANGVAELNYSDETADAADEVLV